jgi:DNA-binding CsgD family transcriptional regulator
MPNPRERRIARTVAVAASRAGWTHTDAAPPPGLTITLIEIAGEQYAVLEFPVGIVADLPLTPSERKVVMGVLRSQSNAEIAAARGVSVRTIANQLASIYKKLRITSRAKLLRAMAISSIAKAPKRGP